MPTHIAFLRGVNVGGHGRLPMKELVRLLEELGARDVRTYVQSGNAVFRHRAAASGLTRRIRAALGTVLGFEPEVLLRSREDLERAAAANPFPDAEDDPSRLHLGFLGAAPEQADLAALEALRSPGERFELAEGVLYLHAPDGFAGSKLAAGAEKALGVPVTARNWRTVQKVLALANTAD